MPTETQVQVTGPAASAGQQSPFPRRTEDALISNVNNRLGMLASLMEAFGAGDALFQNIAARSDPTVPALLNIGAGNLANFQNQGLDANAFLSGNINAGIPQLQQASLGAGTGSPTDIPIQQAGIDPTIAGLFSNLIAPSFIDQLQGTTEALFGLQPALQGPLPERIIPAQPFRPVPQLTQNSFFDLLQGLNQGQGDAGQGTSIDIDALFGDDPDAILGQLDDGISVVPKTGNFQLEQGEAVIPKQLNPLAQPQGLIGGPGGPGVQALLGNAVQQFPGLEGILPQSQQVAGQQQIGTRPTADFQDPVPPPSIHPQRPVPQSPDTFSSDVGNVPLTQGDFGPTGGFIPPGTEEPAPLNPLQQAIQNTLALQGGPITPDILTAQERQLQDAIDRRVFNQQTASSERVGARGLGGGGLSEQLNLQSQLGGINALTQGLNQLQLGAANQNFQGGLAASNLLSNQALGAGQFGLQQAQTQQGIASSLFESLLRAIQQSQANPSDLFSNTQTVQVL